MQNLAVVQNLYFAFGLVEISNKSPKAREATNMMVPIFEARSV
jgi:hypothetical protein